MLMPSRTAASARAHSASSASSHAVGAVLGRPGGVEGARLEMAVADLGDRADLFQVLVGEDRLAHFEPLAVRECLRGRTGSAAAR